MRVRNAQLDVVADVHACVDIICIVEDAKSSCCVALCIVGSSLLLMAHRS